MLRHACLYSKNQLMLDLKMWPELPGWCDAFAAIGVIEEQSQVSKCILGKMGGDTGLKMEPMKMENCMSGENADIAFLLL